VLLVIAGLGVLVVASQLFVGGAVVLAKSRGVTEAEARRRRASV